MKRHRSLVPLSHDHHDALVQARRLQRAGEDSDLTTLAAAFLRFFEAETVPHFREEEELLFPAVVGFDAAREPLVRALLEHERLYALAALLRRSLAGPKAIAPIMHELGELLVAHVRHEERCLFPLIERLLDESTLAAIELHSRDASRQACNEASRTTALSKPDATLFWGTGGAPRCDAAFLSDRRWGIEDPR
jgi:iron-sulfur cluster repair protein YtfE (RIC family)